MGFFSKFVSGTKANNIIGNGVSNIVVLLRDYEKSGDSDLLIMAAYVTRIAILDIFEKVGYNPMYILYANIDGLPTKLTQLQVNLITYGKISDYLEDEPASIKKYVESILDRGDAFYEIDKKIPYEKKKIFML